MSRLRRQGLFAFLALSCVCAALALWLAKDHNNYDLRVYRGAVRAWLDTGKLYDFGIGQRHNGFTYPPFAALCMLPLAALPLSWLIPLNQALIATAVVVSLVITITRLPALRSGGVARGVLLVLPVVAVTQPVRDTFTFGQVNITLAALVLFDLLLIERGSRAAGIGIGLATAIKLTPGLFVIYLLCIGKRRAAGTATATFLSATAIAAALSPSTSWTFWTKALLDGSRVGSYDSATNQSMAGVLARLANSGDLPAVWLPPALLFTAVALRTATRLWREGERLAGLTVVGLTTSVVSPISWFHHFWWVVPALLIILDAGLRRRSRLLLALCASFTALYISGLPDIARARAGHHHTLVALIGENAFSVATALLVIAVPWALRYAKLDSSCSTGAPVATASLQPMTAAPAENPTTAVRIPPRE